MSQCQNRFVVPPSGGKRNHISISVRPREGDLKMVPRTNRMKPVLQGVFTGFLLLLTASHALAQSKDMIWTTESRSFVSGEVTTATRDYIELKGKNGTRKIPVELVSRPRFKDEDSGMHSVRTAVNAGQLEDAQSKIRDVKATGRPFVKDDIAFYSALINARLALKGTGNVNSAAKQVNKFLRDHQDSFRYYAACELMGDLAMSLGKHGTAARFYGKLGAAKSLPTVARGALRQGDAWLQGGELQKAAQQYAKAAKANDARLSALGTVGQASCLAANGKADVAIQKIDQVIADNESKDTELFARVYNAKGRAYLAEGDKMAALDAFLHTDLLFYRESDLHAEALYHLSTLWNDAKKPDRAAQARQKLKSQYAATSWAKK